MLGIFINNDYFFKDTDFTYNPPFVFRTNHLQTNFSNFFDNSHSFKSYNIFENVVNFFLVGFII